MIWPGVVLMVCGLALRLGVHGHVEHTAGIVIAGVGGLLVVAGLLRFAFRTRRRLHGAGLRGGLRYAEREDFSGGIPADYRTSRGKIFAMVVVLVYLFSPFDLAVLEFLLPVGVIGDTSALAWLLLSTRKEVSRHRQAHRLRRAMAVGAPQAGPGGRRLSRARRQGVRPRPVSRVRR